MSTRAVLSDPTKHAALQELEEIPGVGQSIALDLWDLGYHSIDSLKGQDPENMYEALRIRQGGSLDRCVLYVFRCAVYFASHNNHNPDLLKWLNWSDKRMRFPTPFSN